MQRRGLRPLLFGTVGVMAVAMAVTACSGGSDGAGGSGGSAKAGQQVGWAEVRTPRGYVVLDAAQRPQGWSWAAQDKPGTAGTVQLAVDGELGYYQNAGLAMGVLQAGPQVGSLPSWTQVGAEQETSLEGADQARTLRFTYQPEQGQTYHGVWVVGCRKSTRQCISAQVTSSGELDQKAVDAMFAGLKLREDAKASA